MNNPSTEITHFGIIILESIPKNERQTGKELYEDILRYKPFTNGTVFCNYINLVTKEEFKNHMLHIHSQLKCGDLITLHFETHGSDEGIVLASGELIKWNEFYDLIRPINIHIGHLLVVVMSMCYSIAMLSSICLTDRAPYRAFICTTREMYPNELYEGFISFYEKYTNLLDVFNALKALQGEISDSNGNSPFQLLSSEAVFDETLSVYRNIDELCINQLNQIGAVISKENINNMRVQIRGIFKELHSKYSDYYNFRDLY